MVHKTPGDRRAEAKRNGFKLNAKGIWSYRGIDSSGRRVGE
jgi:hypothetical protein